MEGSAAILVWCILPGTWKDASNTAEELVFMEWVASGMNIRLTGWFRPQGIPINCSISVGSSAHEGEERVQD